jgi:putative transposase
MKKADTVKVRWKAIQELESGVNLDLRGHNYAISRATLYNWKSKYSGMDITGLVK